MDSQNYFAKTASDLTGEFLNPQVVVYFLLAFIVVGIAGALISMLSRTVITVIGLGLLVFGFLNFHMYLPLPGDIQADIHIFKARIGL